MRPIVRELNMPVFYYLVAYAALLAAGWLILRLLVRRDYLNRGELSWPVVILQALLFFAYGGFPALYLADDWPAVHVPWLIHLLGVALFGVGLGLLLYGMFRLGVRRSLGREAQGLLQSGLYGRTRNPQVLACGLYVLGFALLWPSWYAAAWAALYGALIHTMILGEEEHLRRQHGESYAKYRQGVPRYFSLGPKREDPAKLSSGTRGK
jgi:protein-S-isoprenylcysteine O-methyltransferase Ste14